MAALLGPGGAYAYLGGYLDGSDGLILLDRVTVPHEAAEPLRVLASERATVDALGVPHGIVPSIAYRVTIGGRRLVFGSDQNGEGAAFVPFAAGADLLVAHFAIPERASGAAVRLHARPSTIGRLAREADVGQLLLSHFMARSLASLDAGLEEVRRHYSGPVLTAEDLDCVIP